MEPHNHKNVLATYHKAGDKEVQMAIEASQAAKAQWEAMPPSLASRSWSDLM